MRELLRRLRNRGAPSREVDPTELRAVFLHISKTAGQSVRQALARHRFILSDVKQGRLGWKDDFSYQRFATRGFARVIRDEIGADAWERCFTFTFVRNPWDRAVSAWRYLDRPGDHGEGLSFPEFLERVVGETKRYDPDDHARNKFFWHVEPQAPQLLDEEGRLLVDFVGRTENLQADFDHACREIGIPTVVLPRVNTTERGDYRSYYDAATRSLVADYYADDAARFGYTFE